MSSQTGTVSKPTFNILDYIEVYYGPPTELEFYIAKIENICRIYTDIWYRTAAKQTVDTLHTISAWIYCLRLFMEKKNRNIKKVFSKEPTETDIKTAFRKHKSLDEKNHKENVKNFMEHLKHIKELINYSE